MPTFTPPVMVDAVPNSGPSDPPWVQRAMSHFARVDRAKNVWIVDNATAQDYAPDSTYTAEGSVLQTGLERTTRFFQGGAVYTVTDAEAAILVAGGFPVT